MTKESCLRGIDPALTAEEAENSKLPLSGPYSLGCTAQQNPEGMRYKFLMTNKRELDDNFFNLTLCPRSLSYCPTTSILPGPGFLHAGYRSHIYNAFHTITGSWCNNQPSTSILSRHLLMAGKMSAPIGTLNNVRGIPAISCPVQLIQLSLPSNLVRCAAVSNPLPVEVVVATGKLSPGQV